jgi:hypothetical protein
MEQWLTNLRDRLLGANVQSTLRAEAGSNATTYSDPGSAEPSTSQNVLPNIRSDEPIETTEADVLGRQHLASAVAKTILDLNARNGAVVAIIGPWGSGKTSLIRLTQREIERTSDILFLEFNPWMFSRADELIERFFVEVASQLKDRGGRMSELAADLAAYGQVLEPMSTMPVIGTWARAGKDTIEAFKSIAEHREGGVLGKRKTLVSKLSELSVPIVVVIDDIDRLPTEEIRDVFKLVRLTGNFPNVIYLLAFDRERVERALEEQGLPGREYLEKIAQAIVEVPEIPVIVLQQQLEIVLSETIERATGSSMRVTDRLVETFHQIIRPNFRHLRDVRRYGASIPATIRSLEGRIALEDVLALEAIRLFRPELFRWISQNRDALTYRRSRALLPLPGDDEVHARAVKELLEQHPENASLIKATIRTLFPLAAHHVENVVYDESSLPEWQQEHRVAHPDFLALYLERMAPQELAEYWFAEQAITLIDDPEAFAGKMMSIPDQERVAVIRALQVLAPSVPQEKTVAALTGVLNLADALPKFGPPTLSFSHGDPRRELRVLVYRLLASTTENAEAMVRTVLSSLHSVGAKLLLLKLVGQDQDWGHGLIDQAASNELEAALREELRNRKPSDFASERDVLWTLMWAKKTRRDIEPEFVVPADQSVRCTMLRDALTRAVIGGKTIQVENQLYWNALLELFDGEAAVQAIVDECASINGDEDLKLAVDLSRRYLEGWRPEHP